MEERNYTVYRHIAPNGKMYVGITKQEPEKRWANGRGYTSNKYFTNAINKYGWDNFEHEIMFEGLTKEQAELAESILIAYYNLTDKDRGYNINNGGQVIGTHSLETRRKMSEAWTDERRAQQAMRTANRAVSDESRRKMSIAKQGKYGGENHPMYGKRHTEESKKKMSIAHRNISDETRRKMSESAKKHVGDKNPFYGKHHTSGAKEKLSQSKNSVKRAVVALNNDTGEVEFICESLKDAERRVGRAYQNIRECCIGKKITSGGYRWKFYDDYINEEERRNAI